LNNLPLSYIGTKHDYFKKVPMVLGFKCATFYGNGVPHIHDCAEIWYALRGKSIHKVGDETFIQTEGTCVVVPAFVPHDNKILKTDETPIFACINISDDALRERGYEHFSYYDKKILFDGKILPRFHKFSRDAHARADEIIHKLSSEFSALPDASFDVMLSLYTDFLKPMQSIGNVIFAKKHVQIFFTISFVHLSSKNAVPVITTSVAGKQYLFAAFIVTIK